MKILLLVAGIAISLTAVFANQLGIDNDAGWGTGRMLILAAGIFFILLGAVLHFFQSQLQKAKARISERLSSTISRDTSIRIVLVVMVALVAVGYVWYTRLDERDLDRSYNYYGELARGFKMGQLHLTEEPSAALLALSDPYDYSLRKQAGVEDFPWDVSLYEGKFYIYWGPTPSLFLLPFGEDFLFKIEDHQLALTFAFGLFIYAALIAARFWRRFFRAPLWGFLVSLLVLGFSIPAITMLSGGNVYEAAIFSCQFFFIGGIYWTISAFDEETPSIWKLVLASVHWGLAVGSRMTILPAVAFTAAATLIFAVKRIHPAPIKKHLPSLIALGVPLLIAGVMLGWYNWARFGSIFEFGIKYQLANVNYNEFTESFSPRYFSENVKQYFAHPIRIKSRFPFISPVEYTESNDRLAGLLFVSPFILLLLAPPVRAIFVRFKKENALPTENGMPAIWMASLLGGSALIAALVIMCFYFITMRYTEDFMPALLLFTILLVGREFQQLNERSIGRTLLTTFVLVTAFITVTAGLLIAMPDSGVAFMVNLLNSVSKLTGFR